MRQSHETVLIDGRPYVTFNGELRPVPSGGADDDTPEPAKATTPTEPDAPDGGGDGDGGDDGGDTPESSIPDIPENIGEIEEGTLRELHATLESARVDKRDTAKTPADLDVVKAIVDRQNAVASELHRRRDEAQQVAEGLKALDEAPVGLPDLEPALAGAGASAAALAAAGTPQSSGEQNPPAAAVKRTSVAMLAAADADGVPTGTELSWEDFGASIDLRKGGRGKTYIASLPAFRNGDAGIPELLSKDNGLFRNMALIEEAQADFRARRRGEAAVARQGAICEPFDIIREIPDAFSTAEPVRGIFPARPAGRLGFQYIRSIGLADVAGGSGIWSEADQDAVDPDDSDTWKPCIDVTCGESEDAMAEAITACLTYDITTEMSSPERVRNFTNALMSWKARVKEGRILQRIDALSHSYQFFGDYGALPAVIEALNTVLAQLTFADRLNDTNYVLVVPPGVSQVLTIDRANRGYNNDATEDVMSYLRANVEGVSSIVNSLDGSLGGEPGIPFKALTPVTDPPTPVTVPYISGNTFRFRLVEPAAAIYSETGEMNMGTTRDSRLIRMNKSQLFVEEFFFLAKNGPEPWATVDVTLCADGSRAGLVEPLACDVS